MCPFSRKGFVYVLAREGMAFNPDFHMCDEAYGHDLSDQDCRNALAQLPHGSIPIPYNLDGSGQFGLPYQKHSGQ